MLKEQSLRKKMNELGLSSQGSRTLLERRHREWLTLWNANCDASCPKKRHELLRDLDIWERTQGNRAPPTARTVPAAITIKDKDFDGAAWAAKHNASFKDLVASARKSGVGAKTPEAGDGPESTADLETLASSTSETSNREHPDTPVGRLDGGSSPKLDTERIRTISIERVTRDEALHADVAIVSDLGVLEGSNASVDAGYSLAKRQYGQGRMPGDNGDSASTQAT